MLLTARVARKTAKVAALDYRRRRFAWFAL
jgi:hypothetical protein